MCGRCGVFTHRYICFPEPSAGFFDSHRFTSATGPGHLIWDPLDSQLIRRLAENDQLAVDLLWKYKGSDTPAIQHAPSPNKRGVRGMLMHVYTYLIIKNMRQTLQISIKYTNMGYRRAGYRILVCMLHKHISWKPKTTGNKRFFPIWQLRYFT